MEGPSGAGAGNGSLPTLHDDFMQTLHDTGMYNYAQDNDLIQDGQLFDARMHDELRMYPQPEGQALAAGGGLTDEDLREGESRMAAASDAAERAVAASEQVRQRLRAAAEAEAAEEGAAATPSKPRKARRGKGGGGGGGEAGGRGGNKGLRHFSMKVCEKVEGKGRTTYNEVADELVTDLPGANDLGSPGGMQFDEKNIRRRVYDALNVLMAMGIISREKKEITWQGLPQGPQLSLDRLKAEKQKRLQRLDLQRKYIADLVQQQATYRALIRRNQQRAAEAPQQAAQAQLTALPLPFVLIQVDRNATVEIKISEDNRVAHFDFEGMPFSFTGDEQVLQEMGLHDLGDALTARALAAAAAADAASPQPHAGAGRAHAATPGQSRAHPGLASPPAARPASSPGQRPARLQSKQEPPPAPQLGQLPPQLPLHFGSPPPAAAVASPQLLPAGSTPPAFHPFPVWQGLPPGAAQAAAGPGAAAGLPHAGGPQSQGQGQFQAQQPPGRWEGY